MRDMLEDSINRILAEQVTPEILKAAEDGAWQASLHRLLDDGGFTRAVASERFHGVGASWDDAFPIVFASGRYALPLAVPESLAACWLLEQCGMEVPAGNVSLGEAAADAVLERKESGWRMYGRIRNVGWGRQADYVVASILHQDAERIVLIDRRLGTVKPGHNIAREARDEVAFSHAEVLACAPRADAVPVDAVRVLGALMRAGQLAGAMDRVVELCVRYANDRIQFGKPIGKFQAIQQQLAVLASQSASVGAAAEYAFARASQGHAEFATACAKQLASEVAGNAAAIAHAVHGAIGFTYEHTLHYLTRRLWAWRSEFGTHTHWAEKIGQQICAGGGASLWPALTAESVVAA